MANVDQGSPQPSKSLFQSKTFWSNVLGALAAPLFTWLATKYAVQVDAGTQQMLIEAVSALAVAFASGNVGLRVVTTQPVHITSQKSGS